MPERRRWRPQMTDQERLRGLIFFALYFLVFRSLKLLVEWAADRYFELYLSEAMAAAVYYLIIGVLTVIVFGSFLKNAGSILRDFLSENLLAFGTGLVGALVLGLLIGLIPLPVVNPDPATWREQFSYSPLATVVILVVLMPLIEEVLFRGLVFGTLRRYSRTMAWIVSGLLFVIYSVWPFAVTQGDVRYLLLAIQYASTAAALTWCYDRGGSIWSSVALHAALDGIALVRALHA